MAKRAQKFQIGDRVVFSRAFLRNTAQVVGWAPFARGTVLSKAPFAGGELCRIQWDEGCASGRKGVRDISAVIDCNLIREDRRHLEAV